MTQPHESRYEIADFFQVRTPLFPVDAYRALTDGEPVLAIADPLVQRAIAVGSISLYDELMRAHPSPRDEQRRAQKFLRYQIRMATRPTPYGMFAGVALGTWGEQTDLAMRATASRLHVRPDMEWVLAVIWEIESVPAVRRFLSYFANTAVWLHNGRLYALSPVANKSDDITKVPSIRATRPAVLTLTLARRPIAYADLCAALLEQITGATEQQVTGLLDELWRQGMLLSDLRPTMTGADDPASEFYERIAEIPLLKPFAIKLRELLDLIATWESAPHSGAAAAYRDLTRQLHAFRQDVAAWARSQREQPATEGAGSHEDKDSPVEEPPPDDTKTVLQVDVAHELAGATISRLVADEATRLANVLMRLAPPEGKPYDDEFKQKFIERYGLDRDVPLLELLNPHFGLGDPAPKEERRPSWQAARDNILLELAATALHQGQPVIGLTEDLISRLEGPADAPKTYVPSLDLNLLIAAPSADAIDRGEFLLAVGPNFGAMQAGRNMGRFVTLVGDEMRDALQSLFRREEQLDAGAVWAEVAYVPYRNRLANVALRPLLRSHEIAFGTYPGADPEQVIPLDEIAVRLRNERFVLRWATQDRDIRVTVGHMLNPMGAPGLVRFLEQLPLDGVVPPLSFLWGAASAFPYLPRVQYGKSILSPARWTITTATREQHLPCVSPSAFSDALDRWRECWRVPRSVYLAFADNRLLLDLEARDHWMILYHDLKELPQGQIVTLEEAIPGPDDAWVPGPGGRYLLELNVPFIHRLPDATHTPKSSPVKVRHSAVDANSRSFAPGSEWLFMKLYASPDFQDDLLIGPIAHFTLDALQEGYADDWFFIRYGDPDPHLRLRFHGEANTLLTQIMPIACQWGNWLMRENTCTRFTFDIYDREVERYGGLEAMIACERFFGADSRFVLDVLATKPRLALDPVVLGAITTDIVVASLLPDPSERLAYYTQRATNRKTIGPLYRQHGRDLFPALFATTTWAEKGPEQARLAAIRDAARQAFAAPATLLRQLGAAGRLYTPREALLSSLVHMHCNRLLGITHEGEEQVVGLLLRAYESWVARHRQASKL